MPSSSRIRSPVISSTQRAHMHCPRRGTKGRRASQPSVQATSSACSAGKRSIRSGGGPAYSEVVSMRPMDCRGFRGYYTCPASPGRRPSSHLISAPMKIFRALAIGLFAVSLLPVTPAAAADGVNTSPLPLVAVRAYPKYKPRRPVAITHAGDGSQRLFVLSEYGQILILPKDQGATEDDVKTFLDIEDKVDYMDRENEEGLLGLAFHPKYKENGQFFIYYTSKVPAHTSIISRFKVSKGDPNKADPASEEVLLTIPQPAWNHNGGNLAFGPDGYLYIGLGDGGGANNVYKNAQKLTTLLSSILRIDVDRKWDNKPYAIPADNPFVKTPGAMPEIYAYGVRNIWGMSFDPVTKLFWAGEVGQDIWEEVDIIEKGGNYGWDIR